MKLSFTRLKLDCLMEIVAVTALVLVVLKGVWFFLYDPGFGTHRGSSSGLLLPGRAVVLCDEYDAVRLSEATLPSGALDYEKVASDASGRAGGCKNRGGYDCYGND